MGSIHLLPLYPSTGDRGFAPVTYQQVNPEFGELCYQLLVLPLLLQSLQLTQNASVCVVPFSFFCCTISCVGGSCLLCLTAMHSRRAYWCLQWHVQCNAADT
jgi:hypothetical protein